MTGQDFCRGCTSRIEFLDSNTIGRHSRHLPKRLLESYRASCEDPKLQSLKAELALVDTRIKDLLARMDDDGDGSIYEQIVEVLNTVVAQFDAGQSAMARLTLDEAIRIASVGARESRSWESLGEFVDLRRKLSEAETKREATLHQSITAEQALQLIGFMADAMRRVVMKYVPVEVQRVVLSDLSSEVKVITGSPSTNPLPERGREHDNA